MTHDEDELARIDVQADVIEGGLVGLGGVDQCDVSERDGGGPRTRDHGGVGTINGGEHAGEARLGGSLRLVLAHGQAGGGSPCRLGGGVLRGLLARHVRTHLRDLRVGGSLLLQLLVPLSLAAAKVVGHKSSFFYVAKTDRFRCILANGPKAAA